MPGRCCEVVVVQGVARVMWRAAGRVCPCPQQGAGGVHTVGARGWLGRGAEAERWWEAMRGALTGCIWALGAGACTQFQPSGEELL